jgi:hypothetical protein
MKRAAGKMSSSSAAAMEGLIVFMSQVIQRNNMGGNR